MPNFLFYDNTAHVGRSSLRGEKEKSFTALSDIWPMSLGKSASSFVFVSTKSRITIQEQKNIVLLPAYMLDYLFGHAIANPSPRFVSCVQRSSQ